MTPTTVARFLDIESPQVLDLIKGKTWIFSTEKLGQFLQSLEKAVSDFDSPSDDKELVKVKLAEEMITMITQHGMTQTQAGEILGTNQSQVSALMNGNLSKFSRDRLFQFIIRLSDYIASLAAVG